MSGRARAAANVCFYKRNDVIVMGDFHLWSSSPTLAEFHRTPTSCRASEYNLRFLSLFRSVSLPPGHLSLSVVSFSRRETVVPSACTQRGPLKCSRTFHAYRRSVCTCTSGNIHGFLRNFLIFYAIPISRN